MDRQTSDNIREARVALENALARLDKMQDGAQAARHLPALVEASAAFASVNAALRVLDQVPVLD